jgi:hypothetical protein
MKRKHARQRQIRSCKTTLAEAQLQSESGIPPDVARNARIELRRVLGWLMIIVLSAVNLYRAATQSIVGDEALTFHWFLRGGWIDVFQKFDANNHVLYSALAKASVSVFGVSELAIRMPSVVAGVFYLIAAYRISMRNFPGLATFLLSQALLSLNPLVLDFLSLGRGYGLGLAALFWALHEAQNYFDRRRRTLIPVGVLCAVAVCANLVYAVPTSGLFAVLIGLVLLRRQPLRPVLAAILVCAAISAALLSVPLSHAVRDHFYAGSATIAESYISLIHTTIPQRATVVSGWLAAGLLGITLIVSAGRPQNLSNLPAAVLAFSLAALVAANAILGVPLPVNRTGLYLIPLFSLAAVAAMQQLSAGRLQTAVRFPFLAVLWALVLVYLMSFRVNRYPIWWQDSATKQAVQQLRALVRQRQWRTPVLVGVTFWLYPGLEFYRLRDPGWFYAVPVQDGCVENATDFGIESSRESREFRARMGADRRPDVYFLHNADRRFEQVCRLKEFFQYESASLALALPDQASASGSGAGPSMGGTKETR